MKNLIATLGLIFFSSACGNPTVSNSKKNDETGLTLIFEDIPTESWTYNIEKIIPLETTQNNFLSDNLTIRFTSKHMYVFDEQTRDAIHQFDLQGKYLAELITVGEGPEKIPEIWDIIVSENEIEILVGRGSFSEIFTYSIDEKKITEKLKLEVIGFSFEKIGSVYYVYSSYNYPLVDYRVTKFDEQGKIIGNYLKNDFSGSMMPVVEKNFFTNQGITFLLESFNDKVYEVAENSFEAKYHWDFGQENVKKEFFETDPMIGLTKLNKEGFFRVANCFENDNFTFFNIVFQKENRSEMYQVYLDKNSQKIIKNRVKGSWQEILKYPIGISETNAIVYTCLPRALRQHAELMPSVTDTVVGIDDNPVLLFMNVSNRNE
jgi:hypothetical protein